MNICHGWSHRRMPLSATRKYSQDEMMAMCKRLSPPYWLDVENTFIPVKNMQDLAFACNVSSAYHNAIAYNALDDDGFISDMQQREMAFRDSLAHSVNHPYSMHDVTINTS